MAKQTTSKKAPIAPKRKTTSSAPEPITQVYVKAEPRRESLGESVDSTFPAPASKPAPTHDAIAQRAYELYQTRSPWEGSEMNDWLRAESDLSP